MADWTRSMQQTYEFYIVDPISWKDLRPINTVKACTINRDSTVETLGSATLDITENIDECYVRIYLTTVQDGIREKHPLGTFLVQTPSSSFNGRIRSASLDAYTPLLELKEKQPPLGYYVSRGTNIMDEGFRLTQEHTRAPVVPAQSGSTLSSHFIADPGDTWITFLSSLISNYSGSNSKYKFDLDEMGQILFSPVQKIESLQPVWTFDDGNSSILYPEVILNHDIYGIPNVVEVIYSTASKQYYKRAVNDDPNSPVSTVNRGREIVHRVTDANLVGVTSDDEVQAYAEQVLKELSTVEYTITYTHGYCPVRVNDCVLLNYTRAGLTNIKAKVISQSIKCEPGCPVTETAVFTSKLWG